MDCILHITGSESSLESIGKLFLTTAAVAGAPDETGLNIPLYAVLKTLVGEEHFDGVIKDYSTGIVRLDSRESGMLLASALKQVCPGITTALLPVCSFLPVTGNPAVGGMDEMLIYTDNRRAELFDVQPKDFNIDDLFAHEMPLLVQLSAQHRDKQGMAMESLPELINTAAGLMWEAAEQFDWRSDLPGFRKYCVDYIRERFGEDGR